MRRIEVDCSAKEAVAISRALTNPDVRAFCAVVGFLETLPTDKARERVLRYTEDALAEQAEIERDAVSNVWDAFDGMMLTDED